MPDLLRKIPFAEDLFADVQGFDCGDEEWEAPLAGWIKAAANVRNGALYEMRQRRVEVWLHANEAGDLVGYSSLGPSRWEWPTKDDPRVPLSIIPNVAIQRRFWGQPKDDPPRYAAQILDHLIFEARKHNERQPLLGLFVDPRNVRAMQAYRKAGFLEYFRLFVEEGIEYRSMLLKLAAPEDTTS